MARPASPTPPRLAGQDDTALLNPATRDRLLDQMRTKGYKDLRVNAIYGRIKAEGYGQYDQLVNAARQRGLSVQMTLMGTPRYSPQWDQSLSWQNNDPRTWQQFAGDVAKHFRGRVARYTPGNEMQFDTFLKGAEVATPLDARNAGRRYRQVYRAGYAGIKKADPGAQVLLGDFSSTQNARAWLQGVMGGKTIRTAGVAFHPYDQPDANKINSWDIDTLKSLQDTLGRYKRQGRLQTAKGSQAPLYLTEFGVPRGGKLTDQQRLRRLAEAYAKAKAAGARQLLTYQFMPTARPMTTTPGAAVQNGYGQTVGFGPNRVQQSSDWVWDTSIADATGNIPAINRGIKVPAPRRPRARAARAARRK